MTTGYNAGLDSSDVVASYAEETVWATLPAVAFQGLRMMGEGFSESKTRTRPQEINALGYAAHAITTQVQAEGSLNVAFSAGTYDDLLGGLLNSTFSAALNINGVAGDISAVASTNRFTSTTSGKFDNVQPGQWVRVAGFTTPANNGYFRVTARVTGASPSITVAQTGVLVDETPAGTAASMRGQFIRNGVNVRTFSFQKQMAAALFFRYLGSYITSGSINASVGGFLEGTMNFLCRSEDKATTNASTGAVLAAPTGRVIDTVAGFQGLQLNDTAIQAVAQSLQFTINKDNARAQFGLGSAQARGIGRGTLNLNGTLSLYFLNFDMYDLYKAETDQMVSFRALDATGAGYIITLPSVTLMNPAVVAGGPDTDLVAEFQLEGNAGESGVYTGVLVQIDKFVAA